MCPSGALTRTWSTSRAYTHLLGRWLWKLVFVVSMHCALRVYRSLSPYERLQVVDDQILATSVGCIRSAAAAAHTTQSTLLSYNIQSVEMTYWTLLYILSYILYSPRAVSACPNEMKNFIFRCIFGYAMTILSARHDLGGISYKSICDHIFRMHCRLSRLVVFFLSCWLFVVLCYNRLQLRQINDIESIIFVFCLSVVIVFRTAAGMRSDAKVYERRDKRHHLFFFVLFCLWLFWHIEFVDLTNYLSCRNVECRMMAGSVGSCDFCDVCLMLMVFSEC